MPYQVSEILKVWVGLAVAVAAFAWLLAGMISKKYRRKVIVIFSIVLAMLGMFLTGRLSR